MKLMARKTYRTNGGAVVHVGGLAKCAPVEGLVIYWTIGGGWYSEDGRFVSGRPGDDGENYQRFLLPATAMESLAKEDHDPKWWIGVDTGDQS